ncbi:MAG: 30S ribosomal protein S18 [Parcubacteria group bacterium SW_6_46_9]|jgi:small subunit ribosomal protein S18|nr:MAG: 30S ribosomal protein S18 [Parcubacteria group bacterium SW_6_46_9]
MSDYLTEQNIEHITYKDTDILEKFLTEHGRIQHRRDSGLTAKHQRQVTQAIKRARYMGLLPYTRA